MQMNDYFYQKDLYLPLTEEKQEKMTEEWALLYMKVLAQIRLCLIKQVAFYISKEKTTSDIMSVLANYYKKQST